MYCVKWKSVIFAIFDDVKLVRTNNIKCDLLYIDTPNIERILRESKSINKSVRDTIIIWNYNTLKILKLSYSILTDIKVVSTSMRTSGTFKNTPLIFSRNNSPASQSVFDLNFSQWLYCLSNLCNSDLCSVMSYFRNSEVKLRCIRASLRERS